MITEPERDDNVARRILVLGRRGQFSIGQRKCHANRGEAPCILTSFRSASIVAGRHVLAWLRAAAAIASWGARIPFPPGAHTIAVPAFVNQTTTYRIEQMLTEAVVHEFIARTKYRVVPEADGADLVLHGQVTTLGAGAVLFDPVYGRHDDCSGDGDGSRCNCRTVRERPCTRIIISSFASLTRSPRTPTHFSRKKVRPSIACRRTLQTQVVSDVLENF